jgi:hypothetical protein
MELDKQTVKQIISEITSEGEENRRADMLKRHKIYKDGGKEFLLEAVRREFNEDAVKEMRLSPVNILKKIINMKSQVYKRSPVRETEMESDQALVDYYTSALGLNVAMQKANRYYNLFANCQLYLRLDGEMKFNLDIVTPYQYSVIPNAYDLSIMEGVVFSTFPKQDELTDQKDAGPATGVQDYNRNKTPESNEALVKFDGVKDDDNTRYVIWTNESYLVVNSKGQFVEAINEELQNPLGFIPAVHLTKDRDNETYSTVGGDMVDLTQTIQLGWSDLLTIAKHQGFSLLTFTGPEAPQKMTIGINRVIWLKQEQDQPTPTVDYVTAASPLSEYKDLLVEQLAMLLSSNDLNPQAVGGTFAANQSTSGFHALIQSADALDSIEHDKPMLKKAEKQLWNIIAAYHNYLADAGMLPEDSLGLGKFSDEFAIDIKYQDVRPLTSESEDIANVQNLLNNGLISRRQALKKLNPDLSDEQVEALLLEISTERTSAANTFIGESTEVVDNNPEEIKEEIDVSDSGDIKASTESLNGAQVTALMELAQNVALGQLPVQTAKNIAIAAFGLTEQVANSIFAPTASFTPDSLEPNKE